VKSELLQRCEGGIEGVLGCFDRVVVTGALTEVTHPEAMAAMRRGDNIRCFEIGQFAEPPKAGLRNNASQRGEAGGGVL